MYLFIFHSDHKSIRGQINRAWLRNGICFKIINFSFFIQVIRALEDKLTSAIEVEVQRREKDMKKMKLRYEVMARMELNAKLSEVNAFLERRAEVNF